MNTSCTACAADLADTLNHDCYCQTIDMEKLRTQLECDPSLHGMARDIAQNKPHMFSATTVFLSPPVVSAISSTINAIERVTALPAWQQQALHTAPTLAQRNPGPLGVFMGYDFHIGAQGPQLIEINTNAGGALLNVALARAQIACCPSLQPAANDTPQAHLEDTIFAMFQSEWGLQRGEKPLRTIAIVDDAPQTQYLAPEFALFKQLFIHHGLHALIADAGDLRWHAGQLWHEDVAIDMVYNRLTDFDLSEPAHHALAQAYRADAVVLTPHPHAHALYADKGHLATLSQATALHAMGATQADIDTLAAHVPACERVTPAQADALWQRRRQLFFKPRTGFGGRAVYRGEKLTRGVWQDILQGDYIAQALVPPGVRAMQINHTPTTLKFDIRAYTYAGQIQLLAARTYSGQTTNFRTEGGGFAPVMTVPLLR